MERVRDNENVPQEGIEKKPELKRFKKIGGGSFILKGKMIKPGQVFLADPNDIPVAFRDTVLAVDGNVNFDKHLVTKASPPPPGPKDVKKAVYEARQRTGSQWWDIYREGEEKPINEKGMTKEKAEAMIQSLME